MEFMSLTYIVTIIGAIGTILTALYSVWKFVIKPLWSFVKKVKYCLDIIQLIQEELKPNGGSSLRDAINRIESCLVLEQHARRATNMLLEAGVFETDSSGLCQWVNRKFRDMTGLSIDDAAGLGWFNSISHEKRDEILDEWDECVSQGRVFSTVASFIKRDIYDTGGKQFITKVSIYASPAKDGNDNLIGYVGIVIPISEGVDE